MSVYIKPIQSTPSLSGEDAKRIIKQTLTVPSKESVKKNKKLLALRKRIEYDLNTPEFYKKNGFVQNKSRKVRKSDRTVSMHRDIFA